MSSLMSCCYKYWYYCHSCPEPFTMPSPSWIIAAKWEIQQLHGLFLRTWHLCGCSFHTCWCFFDWELFCARHTTKEEISQKDAPRAQRGKSYLWKPFVSMSLTFTGKIVTYCLNAHLPPLCNNKKELHKRGWVMQLPCTIQLNNIKAAREDNLFNRRGWKNCTASL